MKRYMVLAAKTIDRIHVVISPTDSTPEQYIMKELAKLEWTKNKVPVGIVYEVEVDE